MKLENTKAQMRKGILELCVLSIISKEEAYPSDIIKKLKESKLIVVEVITFGNCDGMVW